MPTIYQRLELYRQSPASVYLSRTRLKKIYNVTKFIYDKRPSNPLISFVESIEGENVFTVRLYPDAFTKMIDTIILNTAKEVLVNIIQEPPAPPPKKEIKERKKIPSKPKPIYSTRNYK